MGKGNAKRKKAAQARQARKKSTGRILWGVAALAALVLVLAFGGVFPTNGSAQGRSFSVQGGETRPVVNPTYYVGAARAAYTVAQSHREVLDGVYCYCYCDQPPFYHKSLLSCFVDNHAST